MTAYARASRARPRAPPRQNLRRRRGLSGGGDFAPGEWPGFSLASVPARPGCGHSDVPIGGANDPAEAEADRAAGRAMRGERVQGLTRDAGGSLHRSAPDSGAASDGAAAPPIVHDVLARPGRPLGPSARAAFEPRFGTSFADVRIHADSRADAAARAIGARAFTLGRQIAFASGEYAPEQEGGQRLLAHELAHVVQQSGRARPGFVRRAPYTTSGFDLKRSNVVAMAGVSYWLMRTDESYSLTQHERMAKDPRELEAVLAALWATNPSVVTTPKVQNVTVQLPATGRAAGPKVNYQFRFTAPARGGGKMQLAAHFVGTASAGAAATSLPADYRDRTVWDFELEKLRAPSRAPADRLGTVAMPAGLAREEREAIGYAIHRYFELARARNTEIDAIIPRGATRSLMVTLRFGANNDVDAKRIGEPGTGPGQTNLGRIDVTRVNGFPGAAATDTALRAWWGTRYPKGGALTTPIPAAPPPAPTGGKATPPPASGNAALIGEMSRLIARGSATSAWFKDNYQLEVLPKDVARTLLTGLDPARAALVADTRDFTPAELASLEVALQLLGDVELTHLRGVKLARKSAGVDMVGAMWRAAPGLDGLAVQPGTDRIILYFDIIDDNDPRLFRGSRAAAALPAQTLPTVHEFGHMIGDQGGIRTAFDAWHLKNPQTAPTTHSATKGGTEIFTEFYALFRTDPRFLCLSTPLVFAWFTDFARTGKPPPASATLIAPAAGACPP